VAVVCRKPDVGHAALLISSASKTGRTAPARACRRHPNSSLCSAPALSIMLTAALPLDQIRRGDSHDGDGSLGRGRHSVRAVHSQAHQDRRARSDAPTTLANEKV